MDLDLDLDELEEEEDFELPVDLLPAPETLLPLPPPPFRGKNQLEPLERVVKKGMCILMFWKRKVFNLYTT